MDFPRIQSTPLSLDTLLSGSELLVHPAIARSGGSPGSLSHAFQRKPLRPRPRRSMRAHARARPPAHARTRRHRYAGLPIGIQQRTRRPHRDRFAGPHGCRIGQSMRHHRLCRRYSNIRSFARPVTVAIRRGHDNSIHGRCARRPSGDSRQLGIRQIIRLPHDPCDLNPSGRIVFFAVQHF